ncbi:MAG: secretion protein HlyD [Gammaproteobacteria bacterium MedPE]|nr:MAG: secretion protein HlyD [Gammaproteobacteria bacterium MedPE]
MKKNPIISAILVSHLAIAGLTITPSTLARSDHQQETAQAAEVEKGPHNGRMLRDGDFAIELAIFETGVPPEFRIYASNNGSEVAPQDIDINVKLTRLGNVVDDINFYQENNYLRGDMEIYEPHSFMVTVTASYQGKSHQWQYDNFEGRITISNELATSMAIDTNTIGPKTLHNIERAYGKLVLAPNATRNISARFAGEVTALWVRQGQRVRKGQKLLTIESNSNLSNYDVRSPMDGIVTAQMTGVGEQTGDDTLITITNTSQLVAEVATFGDVRQQIEIDTPVSIMLGEQVVQTTFFESLPHLTPQQAKVYRANIDNSQGQFTVGQFAKAAISLGSFTVPMAVEKDALQAFRDFTVVYTKIGEQYEVRMLELGRESNGWIEVKSGIKTGAEYVSKNSYIIKADIEKSGASHDH